jgi:hypothetical protein
MCPAVRTIGGDDATRARRDFRGGSISEFFNIG